MGSDFIPPFTKDEIACKKPSLEMPVSYFHGFLYILFTCSQIAGVVFVFVAKFSTKALLKIKIVSETDIERVLFPDNHT